MGKTGIIAIIIVVLAIAGGAFVLTKKSTPKTTDNTRSSQTTTPASNTSTTTSPSTQTSSANTITYTDNGFSPATLTVTAGTKITIKNNSSNPMQFDSDPHPVHTDDPELNVGVVEPGQSMAFTVTTPGTHGYHNHLDASQIGTIIVQ